jgi:hypothetical protein
VIYLLAFVVLVLASARATRVLFYDEIAAPLRGWVTRKWPEPSWPAKIVGCYWCSSFWISGLLSLYVHTLAAFAGWLPWHTVALLPITTFAVAYGASWVLDKEGIADGA